MSLHHIKPVEAGQIMAEAFTAERQNAIEQALREVSSGQNLRAIGGLRLYRRQGGVTIAMRRRPRSGGGGGEEHELVVSHLGAPAYRMVKCTEAYETSGSPP